MVVAVGKAAKESVATWIEDIGGNADPTKLHEATAPGALTGIHFLGVVHPGGITGGGGAAIKADFIRAADQVRTWIGDDGGFLPADPGLVRDLTIPYAYRSDPVPDRDFPLGCTPRLGRGTTSSNRKDDQRSIQLFSAAGKANAKGAPLDYADSRPGSPEGYEDDPGDIPVEPPRAIRWNTTPARLRRSVHSCPVSRPACHGRTLRRRGRPPKIYLPAWVSALPAPPLSAADTAVAALLG